MYCIYIIKCMLCNSFYIGQTVDIDSRLYTHINNIKKFKMFITDKCVAIHFNLKNHNYLRDFSIYIIKKDVTPLNKRLMCESFFLIIIQFGISTRGRLEFVYFNKMLVFSIIIIYKSSANKIIKIK
jgi:hypothetical protein